MLLYKISLLLPFLSLSYAKKTKTFDFTLSKFTASLDGFETQVLGVNSQVMTSMIVDRGDQVVVNVKNMLGEDTTMHFHGIFQNGTNAYDGPVGTVQCGLQPGNSLSYTFSTAEQHGTYWYHSHHRAQYAKGLRGPLIIRDPENEPFTKEYDEEYIVVMAEWYHAANPQDLLEPFLSANNSAGAEPVPQSILINGKGRVSCEKIHQGKCTPGASLESFEFIPGKTYRLRLINAAAMGSFYFSIDGHSLQVIEADGVDTEKQTVDKLRLGVGQRYSVLVTANEKPCNYWMRASMDTSLWTNFYSDVLDPEGKAIIHYKNAPVAEPTTKDTSATQLDPFTLLPYDKTKIPPESTVDYRIMFAIVPNDYNQSRAFVEVDGDFDYNQYVMPDEPVLFSVAGGKTANASANLVPVDIGEVVDLTIYNDDAMPHTFHLHGHNFWVLKHGHTINLQDNPDPRWKASKRQDFEDDSLTTIFPIRDTIEVPPCVVKDSSAGEGGICGGTKGYVILRFVADNPGIWLFHCHMEWHMQQGLAVTWVEGSDILQKRGLSDIPKNIRETCDISKKKKMRKNKSLRLGKSRSNKWTMM